ncbi:peroxiredoxin family protein [Fimbriiglobus ruber]|uniref:Redoxin domain protein n=1 Tax=Fimbriiglobus ruber TaxID=1908690 RepID=A0A225D924_9BACT|nr:redoxin domain-containing protein [Fimbriiglobus ruber]OWK36144.1 Redoxin domain protein [Fimbriiglobus ruber]
MKHLPTRYLLSVGAALLLALLTTTRTGAADEAPDFPIGLFSDGKTYNLSDYRGKVVVLFFYESECPRCKGEIPKRNEVVKDFEGKPVKFLAIGASDSIESVVGYGRETRLQMPIFADNLGLMEARYGQKISLQNIWQIRVIGPDGQIVGHEMDKPTIEKALAKAAWKYDPKDYDPKLKVALDAFEWSQWDAGMKLLTPLRRNGTKAVADSANKLFNVLKTEAEGWKTEADGLAASEPVKAYDLYTKVAAYFPTDGFAKGTATAKQKLATNKVVAAELAARRAYAQLIKGIATASPGQKAVVLQQSKAFLKKFDGTPTGDKVAALVKDLEK